MNYLSFFSGCMGLDLGLEKEGFEPLLACEFDRYCQQTIQKNRKSLPLISDILDFSAEEIRDIAGFNSDKTIDLVVGGPPCQAFSTAGKRESFNDPRGNVFLHYVNLAIALQPKAIVIENVRGLLSASLSHTPHSMRGENFKPVDLEKPGSALNQVISMLELAGYGISFNLYNAANFGVPQKRERVILIALANGQEAPFLTPTHSEDGQFGLPTWRTFREVTSDLIEEDMHHLNFSEKRLKFYRMLKPGQYWKDLPSEDIKREAMGNSYFAGGGKTGFYRRLAWDAPAPTLVTHPAMPATDLAHPVKDRPLTVEEYKRIQEFPDNWEIEGPLVQQYKQIGNAVPLGLGSALARTLRSVFNQENYPNFRQLRFADFDYSRYKNTDHYSWREKHGYANSQQSLF